MLYSCGMASDLLCAVVEIRDHAAEYQLAEDYYFGRVEELFSSDSAIARQLAQAGNGFRVNLARRPVDAVLDRMKITSLSVPGDDAASEILHRDVWNRNKLDRVEKVIHRAVLMYGDAYLIVWPGEAEGSVEVFYNAPTTTRVFYDEENPRKKRYAAKVWQSGDKLRVNLYYADRIEKYISKKSGKMESDADFMEYEVDGEEWPLDNPYGEVPVFHFRTDEPYGRPEHADAFGPQNAITKLVATQMATTDYQGFPQRYVLMKGGTDELVDWNDNDTAEPGRDSDLESGPGKLWRLPGATEVGEFQPANPENFLKPVGVYTRLMASATATPLRFFDPQGQIPSGEALRADEAPLSEKITDRQQWVTSDWSDMLTLAMRVLGYQIENVEVVWRPVKVVDDLSGWQTTLLKMQAGVPAQQALTESGYLSSQVEDWIKSQSSATGLQSQVETLLKLGQAMQYLGSDIDLGSLGKTHVDAIVTRLLERLVESDGQNVTQIPERDAQANKQLRSEP